MLDLSKYELEALRTEGDLILYRGKGQGGHSQVLVLSSVGQHLSAESLKRLDNEFSLKDELDPSWACQPLGVASHWGRTVLILRDPGGVPLESAFGSPVAASSAVAGARESRGRGAGDHSAEPAEPGRRRSGEGNSEPGAAPAHTSQV